MNNSDYEPQNESNSDEPFVQNTLTHFTKNKKGGYFSSFFRFWKNLAPGGHDMSRHSNDNKLNQTDFEQDSSLIQRANQFLATNNHDLFFKMVTNGYHPNKKQKDLFEEHMLQNFHFGLLDAKKWQETENYLSYGFTLSQAYCADMIENLFRDTISNTWQPSCTNLRIDLLFNSNKPVTFKNYSSGYSDKNISYPLITAQLRKVAQQPDFVHNYYLKLTHTILNKNIEYSVKKESNEHLQQILLKYSNILLANVSFDEFMDFVHKFINNNQINSPSSENYYNQIIAQHYQSDIGQIMNNTKKTYGAQYVEHMTIKELQKIEATRNMELPEQACSFLDNISDLYQKIHAATHDVKNQIKPEVMNADIIFEITTLFEKRLPEILKKYLTIDAEYRHTLKNNQGKNAEDLMLESLGNIQDNFEHHWQEINQHKVDDLSATNRYTQKYKK